MSYLWPGNALRRDASPSSKRKKNCKGTLCARNSTASAQATSRVRTESRSRHGAIAFSHSKLTRFYVSACGLNEMQIREKMRVLSPITVGGDHLWGGFHDARQNALPGE